MDDRRTRSTHHERQEQRNSCRKLQTNNCLPYTDVESIGKYILRSNVLTFELPGIITKLTKRKKSSGTKGQVLIDKAILENC